MTGLESGGIKPNFTCILRKSCQYSGFPQLSCALFHTNYTCNEVTTTIWQLNRLSCLSLSLSVYVFVKKDLKTSN